MKEMPMKEFIKKHPALANVCDVILSLLCGSFALLAFGIAPVQTRPVSLARTLLALVMAATLAVSLVAWAMERLLARAVRLQEENELTI